MTTAKQVDFLLAGYRHPTTNRPLAGGKVETFLDGTSTLSALWTDANKGGNAQNPFELDSAGKAEVYGDNIYKFRIYESDDTFVEEITGLEYESVLKTKNEFETIADLRLYSGTVANETAIVLGYDDVGDGGGGPPRYWSQGQPPGTYVDNGRSIIVPTGGDRSAAWLWLPEFAHVNNITELKEISGVYTGASATVLSQSALGDNGGGRFVWDSSDLTDKVTADTNSVIFVPPNTDSSGASGAWVRKSGTIINDITVTVPTNYTTLQSAIDFLFQYEYAAGVQATVNIATGHALTAGLKLINGDYSSIQITSTDATVLIDSGFTPVTTEDSPGATDMLFVFHQCIAPRFNILIDVATQTFNGVSGTGNATLFFGSGKGVKNCGETGVTEKSNLIGSNFNVKGQGSIFSGASFRGVWLSDTATADMDGVDCTNCGDIGFFVSRTSRAHINTAIVSGSDIGLRVSSGSICMAQSITAIGCNQGVFATFAGTIYCGNATITGSTLDGLTASEGGRIDAREATVTGSTNFNVNAFNGGHISITAGTATGGGVRDLSITDGGFIYAQDTTGTPFVTANVLTDRGVIFQ